MKQSLFLLSLLVCSVLQAQTVAQLKEKANQAADRIESKTIAWRRDLHEHPELGNRETRTEGIIAEHLTKLGLEVKTGVAHTGVVAILRGGKPGPCVALRADMDGLPIVEKVKLDYASKVKS